MGIELDYLDFGGGFGVPSVQPFDQWDERMVLTQRPVRPVELSATPRPADYARGIVALLDEFYPAGGGRRPTIAFEPGRAITSSAQALLLKVIAVKEGRDGINRVILDGGKNVAFSTGYEYHEILPVSQMNAPYDTWYSFYGPLCHPGDIIAVQRRFPRLRAGDVVAIMDAGAYFIPNQMNFSNPRAAAVMVSDGQATLIRERETFDDIVRLDPTIPSAIEDAKAAKLRLAGS
jgi:diaminopimelate decarboxylase